MSSDHPSHSSSVGTYLGVIATLMVLTVITVWAAFQDFGALNTPVALVIACFKAFVVAVFFMHLKYSARIVWMFAGSGVVFFIIMIAFIMGDYHGRTIQRYGETWEGVVAPAQPAPVLSIPVAPVAAAPAAESATPPATSPAAPAEAPAAP